MHLYGADWWKSRPETSPTEVPPQQQLDLEEKKFFESKDKQVADGYKQIVKKKSKYTRRLGFA